MPASTARPSRRRPTKKQDRIVQALREQIVSGELQPDTQLPNQMELVRRFRVSSVTVQRALERLAREGFVVSQPRQGVFVGSHPPHLVDYCLVFPMDPVRMANTNRFLFSLSQIATGLSSHGPRRSSVYYGMESPNASEQYRELVAQVENHRTAGMVFLSPPLAFLNTPLLTTPGIPRVAIMSTPEIPGVTAIQLGSYTEPALDWLRDQGCRRLAMLTLPMVHEKHLATWMQAAEDRGLSLPRHWILGIPSTDAHWAQHAVRFIMDRSPETRPQALIITDDNLVPQASAGLLASGIRLPEDCRVVAHGNFPWATECLVPARRFGPDTRKVFQTCLDLIDAARRAEPIPARLHLPMISEEQFMAEYGASRHA